MARRQLLWSTSVIGIVVATLWILFLWEPNTCGPGSQGSQLSSSKAVAGCLQVKQIAALAQDAPKGTPRHFEHAVPRRTSLISLPPRPNSSSPSKAPQGARPHVTPLVTTWGEEVLSQTEAPWQAYPRPQLVRDGWISLNGFWDFAITCKNVTEPPLEWQGEIRVPFPLESKLSGVQVLLEPGDALWYHRDFSLSSLPEGSRLLLNFEAVDYHCSVYVNGGTIGEHTGGFTPFSMDITDMLNLGTNSLVVRVEDETNSTGQVVGKQRPRPRTIFYTRASGIWQTVWLEWVPRVHIKELQVRTLSVRGELEVIPIVVNVAEAVRKGRALRVSVQVFDVGDVVATASASLTSHANSTSLNLTLPNPKLWGPATPHLYGIVANLVEGPPGQSYVIDKVHSYTGLRMVGRSRDGMGHWRFALTGKTLFHYGPLDQGFWPDGILSPPSEEAMLFDMQFLKEAGFNLIRKHLKVEPRRYYYHCDRLGLLVWQDHVSGGVWPKWTHLKPKPAKDAAWSDSEHGQWMYELEGMISNLYNHPSVVVWTPFNECMGQHRTMEVGRWVMERDPTRLVNIASGGNFWPVGHIADEHHYPHPGFPSDIERFHDYIKVVGEFGGHGWRVEGHTWMVDGKSWGYGGLGDNSGARLKSNYSESVSCLAKMVESQGIAGGVYTQTTDVELEVNGLMTYDRKFIKIPAPELREMHRLLKLYTS